MQIDLITACLGVRDCENHNVIAKVFSPLFENKENDASTETTG